MGFWGIVANICRALIAQPRSERFTWVSFLNPQNSPIIALPWVRRARYNEVQLAQGHGARIVELCVSTARLQSPGLQLLDHAVLPPPFCPTPPLSTSYMKQETHLLCMQFLINVPGSARHTESTQSTQHLNKLTHGCSEWMNEVMNKGAPWKTTTPVYRSLVLWKIGVHSSDVLRLVSLPGGSPSLFLMGGPA